jgi:signal transduction histidine kinase
LHWFGDEYTQTYGVPVEVQVEEMPVERLAPEAELALFRIAQEALTNSGKYAGARHARVHMSFPDHAARLEIEDDGLGFDVESRKGPSRRGGLGLYGMQERAELLGGTLRIESAPGHGTRVAVEIPLANSVPVAENERAPGQERG